MQPPKPKPPRGPTQRDVILLSALLGIAVLMLLAMLFW